MSSDIRALYDTDRTVTIDGATYTQAPAKVIKCELSRAYNGILALDMMFESEDGGWGQGLGGFVLDTFDKEADERVGTKEGMDLILELMRHFEAERLEDIVDRRVFIYREGEGFTGMIRGFNCRDKRKPVFFPASFFGDEEAVS